MPTEPPILRTFRKAMRGIVAFPIENVEDSSPKRLNLSGIGSAVGQLWAPQF